MENKKGSLSTVFLVIAINLIVVMGALLYMQKTESDKQIAELENNASQMQETINNLQGKIDNISNTINDSKVDTNIEDTTAKEIENNNKQPEENLSNEYSIEKAITWTPNTTSYDFNTKKWLPNDSAEYYVATDKDNKLCIVDREKNLVKKFDIVITDLITSAYVAEWEKTLTIIQKDATAYDINITAFTYRQYQYTDGY